MRISYMLLGFIVLHAVTISASQGLAEQTDNAPNTIAAQCDGTPMLVADGSQTLPGTESGSPSGEVQERAVPRLGPGTPGITPVPPRREFEQAIVEGNRITAKPGYSIQILPNGEGILAGKKNGPSGPEIKCICTRSGLCNLTPTSPSSATCVSNGCTGDCGLDVKFPTPKLRIQ